MEDNRGFTYRFIEKYNRCDICYEEKQEFFTCNICIFWTCPKCFNNIFFNETSKCLQCRIFL